MAVESLDLVGPAGGDAPVRIESDDREPNPFGSTPGDDDPYGPLRRAVVRVAVLPLTVLIATRAVRVIDDPILATYGLLVLATTVLGFYVAFSRYRDPSLIPGEGVPDATVLDLRSLRPRRLDAAGAPIGVDGDGGVVIDLRTRAADHRFVVDPEDLAPGEALVSVLVAVHDDEDIISACVESLLAQQYRYLEVIVVDDASTDRTPHILADLHEQYPIRVLTMRRNVGKKRALCAAMTGARGSVIAFTDSDCVLAPDAIGRCVFALDRHPELGAVSGHARALNADHNFLTRMQDAWYEGQFSVAKAAEAAHGAVTCVSGPLAVFRREAIENYLPAWAADRFAGREFKFATDRQLTGYVLGQRWIGRALKEQHENSPFVRRTDHPERRWDVGYVQSARVWTHVPSSIGSFVRQQVRWKKSFIRNLFFTGRFYWHRGLVPSVMHYGHVMWVAAAPVMAFRHLIWLPLHGAWLLTGLYLCGVLLKGGLWGLATKARSPGSRRWVYRPPMSLLSATVLAWLLPYAALTLRQNRWVRPR